MNNRRELLTVGTGLAALFGIPDAVAADNKALAIYLHGMVWNQQLPAPMSDWLLQLDAKVQIPLGASPASAPPEFATFGDTVHTGAGAHVALKAAVLSGDQLTITGSISEAATASLIGQPVQIEGKIEGTAVEGLTVTVGGSKLRGRGYSSRSRLLPS
jgi:hypothetical protein